MNKSTNNPKYHNYFINRYPKNNIKIISNLGSGYIKGGGLLG